MKIRIALTTVATCAVAFAATNAAFAQSSSVPFSDVPSGHWAAESITALANAGIINGYSSAPLAVAADASKGKSAKKAKAAYDGSKPVTRYELAVTLYKFVQYIERADKQLKTKDGAMAEPKTGAEAVAVLVKGGYLPKDAAFVSRAKNGGNSAVTANEFADAVGTVVIRIKERTTPVSKGSLFDIPKPDAPTH